MRENALLEDLAVETMKVGGHPLLSLSSDKLTRRSYDEVPAVFDSRPSAMTLAITNTLDVVLSVDAGESETVLAACLPSASRRVTRPRCPKPPCF